MTYERARARPILVKTKRTGYLDGIEIENQSSTRSEKDEKFSLMKFFTSLDT